MTYEEQKKIDYYDVRVVSTTKDMEFQATEEPNSYPPFINFRKKDGSLLMIKDESIIEVKCMPIFKKELK